MEHSPGSWVIKSHGKRGYIYSKTHECIGEVDQIHESYGETNAQLIAAAPDLLESTKELLEFVVDEWTGSNHKCLFTHDVNDSDCPISRAEAAIAKATP